MSIGALAATIVALIIIVVLVAVGIFNIQKGRRELLAQQRLLRDNEYADEHPDEHPKAWHQQLFFLFGINNIAFAALVAAVIPLLLTKSHSVQYSAIIVIVLLLLISILLTVRCIVIALRTSQEALAARQRTLRSESASGSASERTEEATNEKERGGQESVDE